MTVQIKVTRVNTSFEVTVRHDFIKMYSIVAASYDIDKVRNQVIDRESSAADIDEFSVEPIPFWGWDRREKVCH